MGKGGIFGSGYESLKKFKKGDDLIFGEALGLCCLPEDTHIDVAISPQLSEPVRALGAADEFHESAVDFLFVYGLLPLMVCRRLGLHLGVLRARLEPVEPEHAVAPHRPAAVLAVVPPGDLLLAFAEERAFHCIHGPMSNHFDILSFISVSRPPRRKDVGKRENLCENPVGLKGISKCYFDAGDKTEFEHI